MGLTVLMVTHEHEMAAYARTIVHFRDGLVGSIDQQRDRVQLEAEIGAE